MKTQAAALKNEMTIACALSEETPQGIQLILPKAGQDELFPDG